MCQKFVTAVEKSKNSKTGNVSATYAPIQSCPKTCPFLDKGCYAQSGPTAFTLNRLNKNAEEQRVERPIEIAREEAKEIEKLSGNRNLRLHVVGDARTPKAAKILAEAAKKHMAKNNKKVWTYTHAWKSIPRDNWGDISVLASCENIKECEDAMSRGYAPSLLVPDEFKKQRTINGIKMTACPALLNKEITCETCGLCMSDKRLLNNKKVICFFPHGVKAKKAREAVLEKM